MRILITGTNTINKGAELMLYAILQEIEKVIPNVEVFFPYSGIPEGIKYINTTVNFKKLPGYLLYKYFKKLKGEGIFRRLNLKYPYFTDLYPHKNIDVVLDAGGFQFSDQFWIDDITVKRWQNFLTKLHERGCAIIFLPQAFGPFHNPVWYPLIKTLGENADIVMPRENISKTYLSELNFPTNKLKVYPDFTSLVKGIFPKKYESLKGGIAIIPNTQMIITGKIDKNSYTHYIKKIVQKVRMTNRPIYFLNHEGNRDYELCLAINEQLTEKIPIINHLTALEVKGLIASCFLVISSRFHGVASALSSGVPCLATSWSHKYELLYKEYLQQGCLLDINDYSTLQSINSYLDFRNNETIRQALISQKPIIDQKVKEMWNLVWSYIK